MTLSLSKRFNTNHLPVHSQKPTPETSTIKSESNHKAIKQFRNAVHKLIELGLGKGSEKAEKDNTPCITLAINYWPEIIHPNHYSARLGYRIFKIWKNHFQKHEDFQTFLLSKKAIAAERICLNTISLKDNLAETQSSDFKIKILSDAEKQNYEVSFCDFTLLDKNLNPLAGIFYLVIGLDQKIYASLIDDNSLRHISFFGAKPVSFAGEIHTNQLGMIEHINSYSSRFPSTLNVFLKALEILMLNDFNACGGAVSKYQDKENPNEFKNVYTWDVNN